jgi:hypothetical protein
MHLTRCAIQQLGSAVLVGGQRETMGIIIADRDDITFCPIEIVNAYIAHNCSS